MCLCSISSFAHFYSNFTFLTPSFHPTSISFDLLSTQASANAFTEALTEVGMISITDMPKSFIDTKHQALSSLKSCMQSIQQENAASVHSHTYEDGITRSTFATHTILENKQALDPSIVKSKSPACVSFRQASDSLRDYIDEATDSFANKLNSVLFSFDDENDSPMLTKNDYDKTGFKTVQDIVKNGEHLEHFHSYHPGNKDFCNDSKKTKNVSGVDTIEPHVDQGFFITFVPGMFINSENEREVFNDSGFYIELKDGSRKQVKFDSQDDLVFMLGDGVNQFVNPYLASRSNNGENDVPFLLRATPHALNLSEGDWWCSNQNEELSRVWYGRMVLPPPSASHPSLGMTYGELRANMISEEGKEGMESGSQSSAIGCSGALYPRQLESSSCEEGTLLCWHRCMPYDGALYTDNLETIFYDQIHGGICEDPSHSVKCMNPRNQVNYGDSHGDFFPACTNITDPVTPFPTLDNYPRDEDTCASVFEDTYSDVKYDHSFKLNDHAKLFWSVTTDGKVDGKIAFDGTFSWLAVGLSSSGEKKETMYGAKVLMALAAGDGSTTSASAGMDFSLEPTVKEYVIHESQTSFRFWDTPVEERDDGSLTTEIEETDCTVAFSFLTDSISGQKFSLNEGEADRMIWAANDNGTHVNYHGRDNRGIFYVNWSEGKAWNETEPVAMETNVDHEHGHHGDHGDGKHGDSASPATASNPYQVMIWLSITAVSFAFMF